MAESRGCLRTYRTLKDTRFISVHLTRELFDIPHSCRTDSKCRTDEGNGYRLNAVHLLSIFAFIRSIIYRSHDTHHWRPIDNGPIPIASINKSWERCFSGWQGVNTLAETSNRSVTMLSLDGKSHDLTASRIRNIKVQRRSRYSIDAQTPSPTKDLAATICPRQNPF